MRTADERPRGQGRGRKLARRALGVAAVVPVLIVTAWGSLALHFAGPGPRWLADVLAAAWAAGGIAVLAFVRPFGRALLTWGAALAILLLWWNSLSPSNDRDWLPEVARIPRAEVNGELLTVHNVRNLEYRSEAEFVPRWEDRTYDLSRITGLDLFMSYWGSPAIAHTIMSWEFEGHDHLAVSIETRKERGEQYSAVKGFFKQYELCYVAADERDVVRLRTNYRGDQVYLYRLRGPASQARNVLLDYVAGMNELAGDPKFYNAFTDNCTTTIRVHTKHVGAAAPWDWRILLNGYGDEMLYERARIDTSLPFPALKAQSLVNARAQAADRDPEFSRRIREGLPRPQPAP